ncbi:Beclin 1-associated autophagy-related key regulator-like protein [Dinothrombium tinctorium]|uniref:Beclin 1-associated autophagy-related key regulator-like protein n=1 Tax=Dinothrombium tinctorium TaxID=1965070 RepID=A0A443RDC5_9ACAR|nr:Beclin 1-associated autophagy-related key regulator-like protein [Dinothrombium tinctorium]
MAERSFQCFVCCKQNAAFFCCKCIRNGDFTSSRDREVLKERFAEKKLQFYKWREECNECDRRVDDVFAVSFDFDQLLDQFNALLANVHILRKALKQRSEANAKRKARLNEILTEKKCIKAKQNKLIEKITMAQTYVERRKQSIAKRVDKRRTVVEEIKEATRERIIQLSNYVFPIDTYLPDENPETGCITSEENTPLLTFSGGSTNSSSIGGNEVKYVVIEPWLPTNGDYSAYDEWVSLHKDSSSLSELGQRNPAFRISSALAYATQFLSVIAFYLDVRFPKRLKFSEFYTTSSTNGNDVFLTEQEFADKVAKLNINIIYICLFQNVPFQLIHPKHTIQNLKLLDPLTADLGRSGSINIESKFYKKIKQALYKDLIITTGADLIDFDSINESYDDDLTEFDWESLPYMPQISDQTLQSQVY